MVEGLLHPAVLRGGELDVPRDEERPRAELPVMPPYRRFKIIDLVSQLANREHLS